MSSVTFFTSVGGDGSTVSDDANPTTGLANGGHRTRFVPALAQVVAVAGDVVDNAEAALASAQQAAAAVQSAINAPGTSATSTTSLAIGTGEKSLTLAQTGKAFALGQYVQVVSTASTQNWMVGAITAFNATTGAMTINVTHTGGTGTISAWGISLAAPPNLPSQTGQSGKYLKTNGSVATWEEVAATPFSNNVALAQVQATSLYF